MYRETLNKRLFRGELDTSHVFLEVVKSKFRALACDDYLLPTNEVAHHLAFLQADKADNQGKLFH